MILDKDGNITIVTQEQKSIPVLIDKITSSYEKFKNDNIVINLTVWNEVSISDILEFLQISNQHRKKKLSFVVVTDKANLNEMPDEIVVVPTMHEAYDIIEMEEMERDLDF